MYPINCMDVIKKDKETPKSKYLIPKRSKPEEDYIEGKKIKK